MTVKELKEELSFYDDDAEIEFEIDDDVECESWTEDKYGNKSVKLESRLKVDFIGEVLGDCRIGFIVEE